MPPRGASGDDIALPAGIGAPERVEPSAEPAPDFVEVGDRLGHLPEPFREPAVALEEIAGEPIFVLDVVFEDPSDLRFSFSERDDDATVGAVRRAFGLSDQDDAAVQRSSTEDAVYAYFRDGTVHWPSVAGDEPTSLSHADRVVAVHEFGHAVTEMNQMRYANRLFDPDFVLDLQSFRMISEGAAEFFANEYFEAMPAAAQQDARAQWDLNSADYPIPDHVAGAEFLARYALGSRFFEAAHVSLEQENRGDVVRHVMREMPPLTMRSFLDPWLYLQGSSQAVLTDPPIGTAMLDVEPMSGVRQVNALQWFLALAPVVGREDALAAARQITSVSWIGESTAQERRCFSADLESVGSADVVQSAFEEWASADPSNRTVEARAHETRVSGCVPSGSSAHVAPGVLIEAVHYAAMLIDAETEAMRQRVDPTNGRCAVSTFTAELDSFPTASQRRIYREVLEQLVAQCATG